MARTQRRHHGDQAHRAQDRADALHAGELRRRGWGYLLARLDLGVFATGTAI